MVAPHSCEDLHAKALIGYWLTGRPAEFVRIDVPSGTSLTDWLSEQGLKRVDTVPKMVRNAPTDANSGPPDQVYRVYAVIGQALL